MQNSRKLCTCSETIFSATESDGYSQVKVDAMSGQGGEGPNLESSSISSAEISRTPGNAIAFLKGSVEKGCHQHSFPSKFLKAIRSVSPRQLSLLIQITCRSKIVNIHATPLHPAPWYSSSFSKFCEEQSRIYSLAISFRQAPLPLTFKGASCNRDREPVTIGYLSPNALQRELRHFRLNLTNKNFISAKTYEAVTAQDVPSQPALDMQLLLFAFLPSQHDMANTRQLFRRSGH